MREAASQGGKMNQTFAELIEQVLNHPNCPSTLHEVIGDMQTESNLSEERQTMIEGKRRFSFRSIRKMYLKMLPDRRSIIRELLIIVEHEMQYQLAISSDVNARNKLIS
jgi:hypothetical protein